MNRRALGAIRRLRNGQRRRTAVFLGAGASKVFGYPLTSELLASMIGALGDRDFLPGLDGDPAGTGRRNRKHLRSFLDQLLPGDLSEKKQLPLVTSLLSLLDFSLATGQSVMAARSVQEVRTARLLLERGILELLEDEQPFGRDGQRALDRFCAVLSALRARGGGPLSVITTNYDLAADDAALSCASVGSDSADNWIEQDIVDRVDFGFDWVHPVHAKQTVLRRPQRPLVRLLKLHGAVNWLRCPLCDNVYINPWGPIWHQAYKTKADEHNLCHCSRTRLQVQIVSPSFVREMREPNLLTIWKSALDELRAADEWLIVGYSFPDEDLGVRALFTRAYGSRKMPPHITVVQRGDAARERYECFFDKSRLAYWGDGLSSFTAAWRE